MPRAAPNAMPSTWSYPTRSLHGRVVHDLGQRIIGGELPPGRILPNEDELCQQLKVSRTALREAIKVLAAKGLVEVRTKTGTRVREQRFWHQFDTDVMTWHYATGPSAGFLKSLVEMRRVIEPAAAALAAERATAEDVAEIAVAHQAMQATLGDPDAHCEADLRFHAAVFAATHNLMLARMIDLISVALLGNKKISPTIIEDQRRSLPAHGDLLEAIRANDSERARATSNRLLDGWRLQLDLRERRVAPDRPDRVAAGENA
jgi:DNA-binding FadR family transcriptional regulator